MFLSIVGELPDDESLMLKSVRFRLRYSITCMYYILLSNVTFKFAIKHITLEKYQNWNKEIFPPPTSPAVKAYLLPAGKETPFRETYSVFNVVICTGRSSEESSSNGLTVPLGFTFSVRLLCGSAMCGHMQSMRWAMWVHCKSQSCTEDWRIRNLIKT